MTEKAMFACLVSLTLFALGLCLPDLIMLILGLLGLCYVLAMDDSTP